MEKINRVIFFFGTKFTQRDYRRFGFEIIQKRGYSVEAWDFTPWWKPYYSENYTPPDPIEFSGHKVFKTSKKTKVALASLSKTDIIFDPWSISFSDKFYKINDVKIGTWLLGLEPNNFDNRNIKYYYDKIIANPFQLIFALKRKILNMFGFIRSPDFLLTGGKAAQNHIYYLKNRNKDIIKAHALDYDFYLDKEKDVNIKLNNISGPFAVFLDEDIPFHPDYLHLEVDAFCPSDIYYPEINNFFKKFREKTGLKVVIAAHPRSDYKKRGNPYDNCEIIYNNTISLVKHSQIVLAHMSTSMNFSIFYNKPIILLDSNKYDKTLKGWIDTKASALGLKIINISKQWNINLNQIKIEKEKYSLYMDQYIKEPGTPEKYTWDIFCDYLDNLNA